MSNFKAAEDLANAGDDAMNTQDPYSWIDEVLTDFYKKTLRVDGNTPNARAKAKQRLISEFERVKKEAYDQAKNELRKKFGIEADKKYDVSIGNGVIVAQLSKEQNT